MVILNYIDPITWNLLYFVLFIFLLIASIQDWRKKAVSDIIHYSLVAFTISVFVFLFINYNFIPYNILFSWIIFIFLIIMYITRKIAIGDIYIFMFLIYFLSLLELFKIMLFIIYLSVGAILINSFLSFRILSKKTLLLPFILSSISLLLLYYTFNYDISISLLLISNILLITSIVVLKSFEKEINKSLKFKRNVDELVEGDWIENDIVINKEKIPKEILNKLNKYFDVLEEDNKLILRLKIESNKIRKILITILVLSPLIFIKNPELFFLSTITIIIFLTIFHEIFFRGDTGISAEQIKILREIDKYQKLEFEIQEGFPFVPAIFIAFLLSII